MLGISACHPLVSGDSKVIGPGDGCVRRLRVVRVRRYGGRDAERSRRGGAVSAAGSGPAAATSRHREAGTEGGPEGKEKTNYPIHVFCTGLSQKCECKLLKIQQIKILRTALFQFDFC
jgi:hypothetical protein